MPLLTDLAVVRARLDRDRPWSAYALGDLSPRVAAHAEWRTDQRLLARSGGAPGEADPVVLVYRAFTPPILFGIGPPVALQPVIQEIDAPEVSLQLQRDAVAALAPGFDVVMLHPMWRMVLRPDAFHAPDPTGVEPLAATDAQAVRDLFASGQGRGDAPDFFLPGMLDDGLFRGIREGGELVAVAGTHLVAEDMGVCAIGNVYTRGDRRGRGFGTRVTAAVVAAAVHRRIRTVVLNVRHGNETARRLYERLGFVRACDFVEGVARRISPAAIANDP